MLKLINKLDVDRIMYEFKFKGYSIFYTSTYSYQISEERCGEYNIFSNDLNLTSSLFYIEEVDLFTKKLYHKPYLDQILRSKDPKEEYFKYLLTC